MKQNYSFGIVLKLLNVMLFTSISIIFLKLGHAVSVIQVFFLISLTGVVALFPWILASRGRLFSVDSFKYYIFRALFNILAMLSWLEALNSISANDATAISYIIPVFTTILAAIFLGEKLNIKCMIAIGISLGGLSLIKPVTHEYSLLTYGTMMAVVSSLMWAAYDITCKLQSFTEHRCTQAFYNFLFMSIISAPMAYMRWQPLNYEQFQWISMMGTLSAINVVVLFMAYSHAPISILMPFSFTRLVFTAIIMWIIFDEVPQLEAMVGAAIIACSALYIFYQQHSGQLKISRYAQSKYRFTP